MSLLNLFQKNKLKIAKDFPVLKMIHFSEPDEIIQGFGGIKKGYPLKHRPILFVHGNGGEKNRFAEIAKLFLKSGYSMQELWAFSYMGEPSRKNITGDPHTKELADLDQIIQAVFDYTGTNKIDIIAHSLGATLTLYWMNQKNAYDKIGRLVMIAGAPNGFPNMPQDSEWRKEWMDKNLSFQGSKTPFGLKSSVKPDKDKKITYIVIHCGKDDNMINSYGENSKASILGEADEIHNLEGKLTISRNPSETEKLGGLHCSIIMNPRLVFEIIKNIFGIRSYN